MRDDVLEGGEEPADGGVIVFETSVVASVSSLRSEDSLPLTFLSLGLITRL